MKFRSPVCLLPLPKNFGVWRSQWRVFRLLKPTVALGQGGQAEKPFFDLVHESSVDVRLLGGARNQPDGWRFRLLTAMAHERPRVSVSDFQAASQFDRSSYLNNLNNRILGFAALQVSPSLVNAERGGENREISRKIGKVSRKSAAGKRENGKT